MKPRCPIDHKALKQDPERWATLQCIGTQSIGDEHLELRNCTCGTTLALPLKQEETRP
jgi:hypothetical protein